jgi:hypothetical protein
MGDDEIEKLGDVQPIEISAGSPVLFLGVLDTRLRFKGGSVLIDHQTSGIACGRLDARGVVLRPRPRVLAGMQLIERHWFDTSMGAFGTTLEDVLYYRMQLRDLIHPQADCNFSYTLFEEAAYPIDTSVKVLREICEDEIPDSLDDLIDFDGPFSRTLGSVGRWKCLILAENSD